MASLLMTNPDVFSKGDVDRQQYHDSTLYNDQSTFKMTIGEKRLHGGSSGGLSGKAKHNIVGVTCQ